MTLAGTRAGVGAAVRRMGRSRLFIFLAAMGPGIIAANADNDAGAITTWSFIGSKYGYALTWLLVVMTPILFVAQEMNARIGIVTGKGLAGLIRERFTLKLTAFAMLAVMIANLGTTLSEWSGVAAASDLLHVPTWIGVPVVAVGVWFLVTKGNYRKVERVFLAMGLIYGVYIAAGVVSHPDWAEAAKAVVHPHVEFNSLFLLSAIAAIGTTVTPWGQFFIQAAVVDKKLPVSHLKYTRIEVLIGAFLTTGIDFFIMIACVETLFRRGIIVQTAAQAAEALKPIVGEFAQYLFAIGLLNVSMLASAILPLATAYVVCEAFGFESGLDHGFKEAPVFNGLLTAYILIPALIALIPGMPLVKVILSAQTINGVLLPIILVFVLKVINQPEVMGEYVNGRVYNLVAWTFTIVLILLSLALVVSALPLPFL